MQSIPEGLKDLSCTNLLPRRATCVHVRPPVHTRVRGRTSGSPHGGGGGGAGAADMGVISGRLASFLLAPAVLTCPNIQWDMWNASAYQQCSALLRGVFRPKLLGRHHRSNLFTPAESGAMFVSIGILVVAPLWGALSNFFLFQPGIFTSGCKLADIGCPLRSRLQWRARCKGGGHRPPSPIAERRRRLTCFLFPARGGYAGVGRAGGSGEPRLGTLST